MNASPNTTTRPTRRPGRNHFQFVYCGGEVFHTDKLGFVVFDGAECVFQAAAIEGRDELHR